MWGPLDWAINLGAKIGTTLGNNIATGQPVGKNLADVLRAPASPVIINNPPPEKSLVGSIFGGDFKIGFLEKNIIIIGVFALGAAWIFSKRVTINSADFKRV